MEIFFPKTWTRQQKLKWLFSRMEPKHTFVLIAATILGQMDVDSACDEIYRTLDKLENLIPN